MIYFFDFFSFVVEYNEKRKDLVLQKIVFFFYENHLRCVRKKWYYGSKVAMVTSVMQHPSGLTGCCGGSDCFLGKPGIALIGLHRLKRRHGKHKTSQLCCETDLRLFVIIVKQSCMNRSTPPLCRNPYDHLPFEVWLFVSDRFYHPKRNDQRVKGALSRYSVIFLRHFVVGKIMAAVHLSKWSAPNKCPACRLS